VSYTDYKTIKTKENVKEHMSDYQTPQIKQYAYPNVHIGSCHETRPNLMNKFVKLTHYKDSYKSYQNYNC
jgi:hypothetical protein